MNSFVSVGGIQIYVERFGNGRPLLMIPGLGAATWLWSKSVDELSRHFGLVMPDLRGSGRSDKPDHPYSIELFASDLEALLDEFDMQKIDILGTSLGGLIAQYFAATWPERVGKLILVSTTLGMQNQGGTSGEILCRLLKPKGRTRRERLEDAYELNFTTQFMREHPEELDRITDERLKYPQPEFAYYRQLLAGYAFNGNNLAHKIICPTLILAGEQDNIVPIEDAIALKDKVAHARLIKFKGKHLFFFEQSQTFNRTVIDFLKGV